MTIALTAPSAWQKFYAPSGAVYVSDGAANLASVLPRDVLALLEAGCTYANSGPASFPGGTGLLSASGTVISLGQNLSFSGSTLNAAGGNGASVPAVGTTYNASGAITPTDGVSILNNASGTIAMTLANGSTSPIALIIKRTGAGFATVTANFDGQSGAVITLNSTGIKDALSLLWEPSLSTWLIT